MSEKELGFTTRQIHAGDQTNSAGALITPIYQTSTYVFDSVQQGGARFAGEEDGYIYTRISDPTATEVEQKIASLEHGEAAIATASGMGAITATLYSSVVAGDEIVADETLYGCTFALLTKELTMLGVKTTLVDMRDIDALKNALTEKTKVVYFETPCNPTLKVIDIEAVATAAHAYNKDIKVIVDNTFASPYLQRPLEHGADVVVHSATKYINGHGDVIAGFVVGSNEFLATVRGQGIVHMTGAVISPFNAFLISRGLKTLSLRVDRHCENAMKIAKYFENHPAVKKVYYPGLESFDGYEIAKKQMDKPGGMVSIELNADRETTANALNKLKLAKIAVSLGNTETLVEHAASMTHATYSKEELAASGIAEGLVRINVGLEDAEDIIADFEQAFADLTK